MSEKKSRRDVDWMAVRARLAAANTSGNVDPNRAALVLRERALRLGTPARQEERDETLSVLYFSRGTRRYAIESRFVIEVSKAGKLSRIPRAQPALIGVTNLRGNVVPVFDLASFEPGTAPAPLTPEWIVLGETGPDLAFLADSVAEVCELVRSQLTPPTELGSLPHAGFLYGVSADARALIDGEAVLRDHKVFVARPGAGDLLERVEP